MDSEQMEQVRAGLGFFAALDQSGGSTPKALAEYGVDADRYDSDEQMFDLVHAMRTRVVTCRPFDGSRVLAAILFEQTMDRHVDGVPTGQFLWERKRVVPFVKVDQGLADEAHGVQLMKPLTALDDLLDRANRHGMFGTKMRSVIKDADHAGVQAVVDQQFEYAARIAAAGLVPILEPEVGIDSASKDDAEALLREALLAGVRALPEDARILVKLTIPTTPGCYSALAEDPRVVRVLALSGGYSRDEACARLAEEPDMIASFSRALLEGLSDGQTDQQFTDRLGASVEQIFRASTAKNGR